MDLSNPVPILKVFVPKIPGVAKSIVSHTLGLSATSSQWDLRTEVTINVLRSFMQSRPLPVTKVQAISFKAPPIKGKIWVSKVTAPIPEEDDLRQALFRTIEDLHPADSPELEYKKPEYVAVEAEWTGYRAGATSTSPQLRVSESEKYKEMMREVTAPTTILYFHGGAYYLMDPASHRATCQKLAKRTSGRCYSVRYRLAPQHPFPAALLDALTAYLTLLYPPPNSLHDPVDPSNIVFAGDSAGGNLSAVLLLTLQHMRRENIHPLWQGSRREIPLPAGLALNSPWLDITHSSPSCSDAKYDYLPALSDHSTTSQIPPDSAWPATPPRKNLYAIDCLLSHPLVSPLGAPSRLKLWEGTPPVWMCYGDELLRDEARITASQIVRAGGICIVQEWEAMPHCFAMVFDGLANSERCFDAWGAFIRECVERPGELRTGGTRVAAKGGREGMVDVGALADWTTEEEVRERIRARVREMSEAVPDTLSKL